jgi:hypothetical protein
MAGFKNLSLLEKVGKKIWQILLRYFPRKSFPCNYIKYRVPCTKALGSYDFQNISENLYLAHEHTKYKRLVYKTVYRYFAQFLPLLTIVVPYKKCYNTADLL